MAIDGINQMSTDQLMAMSLMSNGQLTNDSTSSTSDETNYAFQLMMQNYLDDAKKTAKENVEAVTKDVTKNSDSVKPVDSKEPASTVTSTEADDNKAKPENEGLSDMVVAANSNKSAREVQEKYAAGQKLLDIPLVINGSSPQYASSAAHVSNNVSKADMDKIYAAVHEASQKYGVDENLLLAIIQQESSFDSTSTSGVGAAGLMQIMPSNYASLGITDPYDVEQNVNGGAKLFKEYLDQYNGDVQMALMAYNAGPGTIQSRGVRSADDLYKMPSETQNYVPKVMGYYQNGI